MTTLFRFFMLLFVTSFTCSTFAQSNTNVSFDGRKLIGKKWYYSDSVNGFKETRTMVFGEDSVKEVVVRGNKTFNLHEVYYLDDHFMLEFWPPYVGKKRGRFLYRYDGEDFYGVIINKLTDDEFIYSFDKKGPFIKYKAIKEK